MVPVFENVNKNYLWPTGNWRHGSITLLVNIPQIMVTVVTKFFEHDNPPIPSQKKNNKNTSIRFLFMLHSLCFDNAKV